MVSLAERVGFEPTVEFPRHSLSRRALSTAQTPLRGFGSCSLTNAWQRHNCRRAVPATRVSHLRRSGLFCDFSQRFRAGLTYAAPPFDAAAGSASGQDGAGDAALGLAIGLVDGVRKRRRDALPGRRRRAVRTRRGYHPLRDYYALGGFGDGREPQSISKVT